MKKILMIAAAFALCFSQAFAENVPVPNPLGIWNNSTGLLQGFSIPGQGMNGYTPIQAINSNGGQAIGAGYASTTPPTNGLIVQGNVGIGSASPATKLDVTGTFAASGASTFGSTLGITGNVAVNTNKFNVTASSGAWSAAGLGTVTGISSTDNLTLSAAAKGLVLKQGANGKVGTFICTSGGDIAVSNTSVATTDVIIPSLNTVGGTISTAPAVKTITGASGFHMLCATGDTSTYNYAILSNAP